MSEIISVHSFRGGTGKSNSTANLSAIMASQGLRVGVVDTDIQSPGIHVLFGLDETEMGRSLNDYLWGKCEIKETAHDVTGRLGIPVSGKIYLIPSSIKAGEIARVLREGYDVGLLNDGFHRLVEELSLEQDYQGTGVTVEVARKLDVPRMVLVVNKTPSAFDFDEVKRRVESAYDCEVAAVLPHADEMMTLASGGIFVVRYPDHPITAKYKQVAERLLA
jgi:MinD-like ATPase involved in chromosome partitioning or flagellar assembly